MFNQSAGYSLADIAAATGSTGGRYGEGMWGDGWWIILLFLFGWGGNGGWGGGGQESTRDAVSYGFDINDIQRGIIGTHNGICDGFYAMNTGMLTGFGEVQNTLGKNFSDINTAINVATGSITNAIQGERINNLQGVFGIQTQLNAMSAENAACCCETQKMIESTTRDIIESNNQGVRSILEFLTQDKIASLTAENQGLKLAASQAAQNNYLIEQLRPSPTPAYIVQNPYGCGCGQVQTCCGATF